MSNRTDPRANQLHGMNPQFLLETILRNKIYNTLYWKEKCFALTSETIIDRALELKYVGGAYGGMKKPTEFICLVLKLLQIQPSDEIILEYISDDFADYKYLRALAAFYIRLCDKPVKVYRKLEPLYNDYRKLRVRNVDGSFSIIHMDEYIETLLNKDENFEITLPTLQKRKTLEENEELEPRISILEADLDLNDLVDLKHEQEEKDEDFFKNVDLENVQGSHASQSSLDEELKPKKKRKIEEEEPEETIDLSKMDPNSDEYWLALRKISGINKN